MKTKKHSIFIKISAFALLLITAAACLITYSWFVDTENATGTITFGRADVEISYANWSGNGLVANDLVFNDTENPPTDLKIKLAQNSDPVYLILVPHISWTVNLPASYISAGVTVEEANYAMKDLKASIEHDITGFGVSGTHNFSAKALVQVEGNEEVAHVYTGTGVTPAAFTSTAEIVVFDVSEMRIPETAVQAGVVKADKTYYVQKYCSVSLSILVYGVQYRNVGEIPGSATALEVCEAAGLPGGRTIDDMSWSEIQAVVDAGRASSTFSLGDEKTITLSTSEQITLVVLGFNHDDITNGEGAKAGITFGMKDLLASQYKMNDSNTNLGGWHGSVMRATNMQTLYNQLPTELQAIIKNVDKKASAGNQSTTITTSSDKLFLFSEVEIDGTTNTTYKDEGIQYDYWKVVKDGKVAANRIKKLSNGEGNTQHWWLRTPNVSNSTNFYYFHSSGGLSYNSASYSFGVSFGFCI